MYCSEHPFIQYFYRDKWEFTSSSNHNGLITPLSLSLRLLMIFSILILTIARLGYSRSGMNTWFMVYVKDKGSNLEEEAHGELFFSDLIL